MRRELHRLFLPFVCLMALSTLSPATQANGTGTIRLGYLSLDEDGSLGSSYRTYNVYEGTAVSLEQFRYDLGKGTRFRFDGNNLTLNNRRLAGDITRPGHFGIRVTNSQNRRTYDFNGANFVRRHHTTADAHLFLLPAVKLYAGGGVVGFAGTPEPLFSLTNIPLLQRVEFDQQLAHAGLRYADKGRTLGVEYRGDFYDDKLRNERDQTRTTFRADGSFPIPKLEKVTVNGGYRYFVSELDKAGTDFSANTVWGGATARLTQQWGIRYAFVFDRAGNSEDFVETDNLTNAGYLTYANPRIFTATIGYQHGVNDDFEDDVQSDGIYASATLKPLADLQIKGDYGTRAEEVREGSRLVGDETWNRYRGSIRYALGKGSFVRLLGENVRRENESIESFIDRLRFTIETGVTVEDVVFGASASRSEGEFTNTDGEFSYVDNVASGDIVLPRWQNFELGGRGVYYRTSGELDIESFQFSVTGDYRIGEVYSIRGSYTVDNFDDLEQLNEYYTANIFEISIARAVSF